MNRKRVWMVLLMLLSTILGGAVPIAGQNATNLVLPQGRELSEIELLETSGGSGLLVTILAGILLGAGSGAAADIAVSYAMGDGMPSGEEVGLSAAAGAVFGGAAGVAAPAVSTGLGVMGRTLMSGASLLKASAVSAARWTACAAVSLGKSAQVVVHNSVRMPIQNALTTAWRWISKGAVRTRGFSCTSALGGSIVWLCLWLAGAFVYHWATTGSAATACAELGFANWRMPLIYVGCALVVGGGVELVRSWSRQVRTRSSRRGADPSGPQG